jgi:hypothetical protein
VSGLTLQKASRRVFRTSDATTFDGSPKSSLGAYHQLEGAKVAGVLESGGLELLTTQLDNTVDAVPQLAF